MRLNNKSGEALTILIGLVLLGLLARPVVDKVLPILGGQQKQVTTQTTTVKPVMVKIDDGTESGKWVLAQKIDENVNNFKGDEKMTFGTWVRQLSYLWFVISLLSAGGVPFITTWYANIKKSGAKALSAAQSTISEIKAAHAGLNTETKKIVLSVDAGFKKIDDYIASAKSKLDTVQEIINSASTLADPTTRAAALSTAEASKARAQSIYNTLIDLKADFKFAMYAEQDESTENLVKELLKNDDTNSKVTTPATA